MKKAGNPPRLFRFGRRCALLVLSHAGLGLILPELGVGFEKIRRVDRYREQHPARREQEQRGDLHEHRAEKRESFGSVSHTSFPCSEDA